MLFIISQSHIRLYFVTFIHELVGYAPNASVTVGLMLFGHEYYAEKLSLKFIRLLKFHIYAKSPPAHHVYKACIF